MITSIHNPLLQRARRLLSRSKDRREEQAYVLEGVRLVEEAWTAGAVPEVVIYSSTLGERGNALLSQMRAAGVPVEEVPADLLERLGDTDTPQGILAVLPYSPPTLPAAANLVVILDGIRDPGNLGTILRTACAAGADLALLSPDCADVLSPKVLRSGMGAHFHIPCVSAPWEDISRWCQANLAAAAVFLSDVNGGLSLWQCDLRQPCALIICNEASGASPAARTLTETRVHIPMPGGFESLNAATAAAILLFEAVRQRSQA
jgi:TrmH family RNA methyltransferase